MKMERQLLIQRWVQPFYQLILNGNYAFGSVDRERLASFNQDVTQMLGEIRPDIVRELIQAHWREALTGSWFAGICRYEDCQEEIGNRLLVGGADYSGQGYTFALACFANEESASYLREFLRGSLGHDSSYHNQGWAMSALMWVDSRNSTHHADEFLGGNKTWQKFIDSRWSEKNNVSVLENCRDLLRNCMAYCESHFRSWDRH